MNTSSAFSDKPNIVLTSNESTAEDLDPDIRGSSSPSHHLQNEPPHHQRTTEEADIGEKEHDATVDVNSVYEKPAVPLNKLLGGAHLYDTTNKHAHSDPAVGGRREEKPYFASRPSSVRRGRPHQGHEVGTGPAFIAAATPNPYDNGDQHSGPRPTFRDILQPKKKLASDEGLTWKVAAMNVVKASWLNVLVVFIPISWALHFAHFSDTLVFCFSFLAIIPLASLLGFGTEQVALRVGDSLGGLLNATFGNFVELIIAILALVRGEIDIVQSSMIGSILSNTLLVLGMCFFAGGLRFHEQGYGIPAAQLNISLLGISLFAIILPSAFHAAHGVESFVDPEGEELASLLSISRGISFMLLFIYGGYLTFQLFTHRYLYKTITPYQRRRLEEERSDIASPPGSHVFPRPNWVPSFGGSSSSSSSTRSRRTSLGTTAHAVVGEDGIERVTTRASDMSSILTEEDEEEVEVPKLTAVQAIILLCFITCMTGFTAEWLIDSIDGLTATGHISREFVALILLPLVGNAAEHVTAVVVSVKDKIDLSITIAVGSSIQIALFVVPVLVLLAWCIGQPLTLKFDLFETVALFLTILLVNFAIQDGRTNYLEGLVLMMSYFIVALVTWFYSPL